MKAGQLGHAVLLHEDAALGPDDDPATGFKRAQGFPHGNFADGEVGRDLVRLDVVAKSEPSVDHGPGEGFSELVGKVAVPRMARGRPASSCQRYTSGGTTIPRPKENPIDEHQTRRLTPLSLQYLF